MLINKKWKIKQIIPSDGWNYAIGLKSFVIEKQDTEYTRWSLDRLICWALVENDGQTNLVGVRATFEMGGEMTIPEFQDNFMGYFHETDDIDLAEMQLRIKVLNELQNERIKEEKTI